MSLDSFDKPALACASLPPLPPNGLSPNLIQHSAEIPHMALLSSLQNLTAIMSSLQTNGIAVLTRVLLVFAQDWTMVYELATLLSGLAHLTARCLHQHMEAMRQSIRHAMESTASLVFVFTPVAINKLLGFCTSFLSFRDHQVRLQLLASFAPEEQQAIMKARTAVQQLKTDLSDLLLLFESFHSSIMTFSASLATHWRGCSRSTDDQQQQAEETRLFAFP